MDKYGLIYACSQKNLGIAGLTFVIIDDAIIKAPLEHTPVMYEYSTHISHNSMLNTPPTFTWFVASLMFAWLKEIGGLTAIYEKNKENAKLVYDFIDNSSFYTNDVDQNSRSMSNVVFYLPQKQLEQVFVDEASQKGLYYLKGHRQVGGLRASLYNAMPKEGVEALIEFMACFERDH